MLGDGTAGVPAWATGSYTAQQCVTANGYLWGCAVAGTATTAPTATAIGQMAIDGTLVWRCLAILQPTGIYGSSGVVIKGEDTGGSGPTQTLLVPDYTGDPSGSAGSLASDGTLTDTVFTFTEAHIGCWIYITTGANKGAWRISAFTSAHVVTIVDPTGEYSPATDSSGTMGWIMPLRSVVRFYTRDCIAKDFQIMPANGRGVYAGIEDSISPFALVGAGQGLCTNNTFDRVVVTGNRSGATLIHCATHGDNPITPAQTRGSGTATIRAIQTASCSIMSVRLLRPEWRRSGQRHQVRSDSDPLQLPIRAGVRLQGFWHGISAQPDALQFATRSFSAGAQFWVYDIESENLARLAKQANSGANPSTYSFVGGRVAVDGIASDGKMLLLRSASAVQLIGLQWDPVYTANFNIEIDNGDALSPAALTAIGCIFPNTTPLLLTAGIYTKILMKNCQGAASDGSGAALAIADVEITGSGQTTAAGALTLEAVAVPTGQAVQIRFGVTSQDTTSVSASNVADQEIVGTFINIAGTVRKLVRRRTATPPTGQGPSSPVSRSLVPMSTVSLPRPERIRGCTCPGSLRASYCKLV